MVDGQEGKEYRLPTEVEMEAACVTEEALDRLYKQIPFGLPGEPVSPDRPSPNSRGASGLPRYGFGTWRQLFTNRQLLALGTFVREIRRNADLMSGRAALGHDSESSELPPPRDPGFDADRLVAVDADRPAMKERRVSWERGRSARNDGRDGTPDAYGRGGTSEPNAGNRDGIPKADAGSWERVHPARKENAGQQRIHAGGTHAFSGSGGPSAPDLRSVAVAGGAPAFPGTAPFHARIPDLSASRLQVGHEETTRPARHAALTVGALAVIVRRRTPPAAENAESTERGSMSYEFIEVSTSDHVTTVTIDRPRVLNALHPYAVREMERAFNAFQDDDGQWVAILTGAGDRAFCAGNDLKFQAEHGPEHVRKLRRGLRGGFGGLTRRTDCYKPIIAAVNGFALGGGFELALACDIIVAAEHATFGLPEPRVGLMAAAGGAHRLPRYIPYHAAMAVLLAGKRLSAAEAHSHGFVNEVVAGDALMETARRWAGEILKGAPLSVRASKEAVILGMGMPLERALDSVFPVAQHMYESEDLVEGPRAFAEKRPPRWKGR